MNPTLSPSSAAWWREVRAVVNLAAPLALSHLSYMAIMLTDVVMMGWIGTDAIAAGSLARDFFWVPSCFALGLLTGATPIMAQHLGARRYRQVRPAVRNAAWLALLLTIPVSVAAWYSSPILVLLGQEQQVADSGQSYLRYLLWGLLPSLWFAVLTEFLAAHARPRAVYVVTLIAIALNALLDYALMFGNFGAPNMGLEGAGVASLVVNWFMLLPALVFWFAGRTVAGLILDPAVPANAAALDLAALLLGVAAFFMVSDAVQIAARGALQGLKDTAMPMVIALATGWAWDSPRRWCSDSSWTSVDRASGPAWRSP